MTELRRQLGRLLRPVRAGERRMAWNDARVAAPDTIKLTSPAFDDDSPMPARCAGPGLGANVSPPLTWSGVPANAAELVLVVQDPDVPLPWPLVHLVATGLDPNGEAAEGTLRPSASGARLGRGSLGQVGYLGPQPPAGHGPHRYVFQLFAVSQPSMLNGTPRLPAVLRTVAGTVLARGRLIGTYERR